MNNIPILSRDTIEEFLMLAEESPRHRYPKLLHNQGAEFNEVFNFMLKDSYMQPHLHPGIEKIEKIYHYFGTFAVIYFDDKGNIEGIHILEKGKTEMIEVPAFKWHTYVMLTDTVISYETMMGVYDTKTWKEMAYWAPKEGGIEASDYLESLKQKVREMSSGRQ